jgi:hypothetical protein
MIGMGRGEEARGIAWLLESGEAAAELGDFREGGAGGGEGPGDDEMHGEAGEVGDVAGAVIGIEGVEGLVFLGGEPEADHLTLAVRWGHFEWPRFGGAVHRQDPAAGAGEDDRGIGDGDCEVGRFQAIGCDVVFEHGGRIKPSAPTRTVRTNSGRS